MTIPTITPQPFPTIVPLREHCDCIINTVAWFNEFKQQGIIARITAIVIGILATLVLFVSIVGWPLIIALGNESERQRETPKVQAAFEQNKTNLVQQFFHSNEDIFDHINPYISSGDLKQLALTSRSFYTVVNTNVLLKTDRDWFAEKGFKTVTPEKTLNQHVHAFTYLDQNWHLPLAMIEGLGGIMKVYELPVVHQEIETLVENWPIPESSIIKVIDDNAKIFCIAFRYIHIKFREIPAVEIYRVDDQGLLSGLMILNETVGINWVELPFDLFLKRLELVMKNERVGMIFSMSEQSWLASNGAIREMGNNTVLPLNNRKFELFGEFDMRLIPMANS